MNTGTKVTTGATAITHDIDIELPEPAFTAGTKIGTTTGFFCRDSKIKKGDGAYTREQVIAAIEPYAKRIAELEAARIAYASEFAPDEDGNPDVGSIHENIRKLKADLFDCRMLAHEWIRPSLGLDGDAPYRFDFYAHEIEKLKDKLKKSERNENDHLQCRGEPVAYLDLGAGGYMDLGTNLTDEQLAALPKGRHMLAIVGTYSVDGYTEADPQPSDHSGAQNGIQATQPLSESDIFVELVGDMSAEQLAEILTAYITPEIIGEALEKLENAPWELSDPGKAWHDFVPRQHQNPDKFVMPAAPVKDSVDIDDLIAVYIARGDITKDAFLEARQWVRDTYYNPAESVKKAPPLQPPPGTQSRQYRESFGFLVPVTKPSVESVKVDAEASVPSNAEILEVWYALPGGTIEHEVIEFARALLARYGNTKQEK